MDAIFFYGSLRDSALLEVVLGRPVAAADLTPAAATGYAAVRLAREAYPALVPAEGRRAEGMLFHRPTADDLDRLFFFEEAEYGLAPITVDTADGPVTARYFRDTGKPKLTGEAWDYAEWTRDHRAVATEVAREYMDYLGRVPVEDIDLFWPDIKIRAFQRARAAMSAPPAGALRTGFRADDVECLGLRRTPTRFLAIEETELRHRRFDGGWTGPLARTVVRWGDAVAVLPYDPRRDRVLLIEQFRPGPAARGDPDPWCIEVIAGRLDAWEPPETTARREAAEEAGLALGRLERIAAYYPTPGAAAEHLTGFVGEADLAGEGGHHGIADEGEDIRTLVLDFDQALAAARDGTVNTAIALISILWLAANRTRLRAEWSAEA